MVQGTHSLDVQCRDGLVTSLLLDGNQIFTDHVEVTLDQKEGVSVTIHIPFVGVRIDGLDAKVLLDDEIRQTLLQLGWKPPEE